MAAHGLLIYGNSVATVSVEKCQWEGEYIEGFRPEWYISTMIYSRDAPFWSETFDIYYCIFLGGWTKTSKTIIEVLIVYAYMKFLMTTFRIHGTGNINKEDVNC